MKAELYILKSRRSQRPECFFVSSVGRTDLHWLQLHLELFCAIFTYHILHVLINNTVKMNVKHHFAIARCSTLELKWGVTGFLVEEQSYLVTLVGCANHNSRHSASGKIKESKTAHLYQTRPPPVKRSQISGQLDRSFGIFTKNLQEFQAAAAGGFLEREDGSQWGDVADPPGEGTFLPRQRITLTHGAGEDWCNRAHTHTHTNARAQQRGEDVPAGCVIVSAWLRPQLQRSHYYIKPKKKKDFDTLGFIRPGVN